MLLQAKELKDLSIQMMTKKTKRLYDRMQHGIQEKSQATEKLESKRKALEADKSNSAAAASSKKPRRK